MVKFLRRLFLGEPACDHTYEVLETKQVYVERLSGGYDDLPQYTKYHLRCSKCGWITKRRA